MRNAPQRRVVLAAALALTTVGHGCAPGEGPDRGGGGGVPPRPEPVGTVLPGLPNTSSGSGPCDGSRRDVYTWTGDHAVLVTGTLHVPSVTSDKKACCPVRFSLKNQDGTTITDAGRWPEFQAGFNGGVSFLIPAVASVSPAGTTSLTIIAGCDSEIHEDPDHACSWIFRRTSSAGSGPTTFVNDDTNDEIESPTDSQGHHPCGVPVILHWSTTIDPLTVDGRLTIGSGSCPVTVFVKRYSGPVQEQSLGTFATTGTVATGAGFLIPMGATDENPWLLEARCEGQQGDDCDFAFNRSTP